MKKILFVLVLLLFSNFVFSLDCQYFIEEEVQTDYNKVINKNTDEYIDVPFIEPSNKQVTGGNYNRGSFLLVNNYPFQLKFRLIFNYGTQGSIFCNAGNSVFDEEITLENYGTKEIVYWSAAKFCKVTTNWDSLRIILLESDDITAPLIQTIKTKNKICLGNDDGMNCSKNEDCGGGFCVEGKCNNQNICFNNNCECSPNEVECNNNSCVTQGSFKLNEKPACDKNELCETGLIGENGLCVKTPEMILQEKLEQDKKDAEIFTNNLFFGIILIIIILGITIGGYLFVNKEKTNQIKAKTEEIKQKQLLIQTEVQKKNDEIIRIENEIKELESKRQLKESESRKLKELNKKLIQDQESLDKFIQKEWDKIKPFPYELARNRFVIVNPYLGGYLCFYDENKALEDYPKSSLVHRWIWKQANGRWPRPGYHIHHKDGNKKNNNPENLEEIDGEEHLRLHKKG
jgi:hypothetical protein